jgi:threonyl-tRNA synthetase
MITITLPDSSQKHFDHPVTVAEVVNSIGAGLARSAIAAKVSGQLVDLSHIIQHDSQLIVLTEKNEESLEVIRHSSAHLLGQAVKALFPTAQVTIGPVIDNGFYYDFAYERPFTAEDLLMIESKMHELAKADFKVTRQEMSRDDAIRFFESQGEKYKVEIIKEIPAGETLSLYSQGDFTDLCRGPHVPSTGKLKAFKLMKLAGAYWRGDAKNEMLQRIYGTAFATAEDLKAYLHQLEEAEKRDHRKIAKELDLFHMQELAPGMVFWHDRGWRIFQTIEQYIRKKLREHDYKEVRTPQMLDRKLWEASGHWENYREDMFTTESEHRTYAIKPMSCPCHVQIFKQGLKSHHDLPLRLAEFGSCHRNEPSGTLHGLMRVRQFTQDDAHIFCTDDQIQDEARKIIVFLQEVYQAFGFHDVMVRLSTRPAKSVGTDELWEKAESGLKAVLDASGLPWKENPGDGAFYGPKIDFSFKDCIGRTWQLGTIQLDYCLPERLGAEYVAEDGTRKVPVMLHRALLGSFERFIGILLEHYAGKLPFWLSPEQIVVMNISSQQAEYAEKVAKELKKDGFRVVLDLRNEKIGFKIREFTLKRIPYLLILGDKELEGQTVSVRTQAGELLGSMSVPELVQRLQIEVK